MIIFPVEQWFVVCCVGYVSDTLINILPNWMKTFLQRWEYTTGYHQQNSSSFVQRFRCGFNGYSRVIRPKFFHVVDLKYKILRVCVSANFEANYWKWKGYDDNGFRILICNTTLSDHIMFWENIQCTTDKISHKTPLKKIKTAVFFWFPLLLLFLCSSHPNGNRTLEKANYKKLERWIIFEKGEKKF